MGKCCEVSSADGMVESGCGAGCFLLRVSRVASFIGASVSSELASLTVPLKSPSSPCRASEAACAEAEQTHPRSVIVLVDNGAQNHSKLPPRSLP